MRVARWCPGKKWAGSPARTNHKAVTRSGATHVGTLAARVPTRPCHREQRSDSPRTSSHFRHLSLAVIDSAPGASMGDRRWQENGYCARVLDPLQVSEP